MKNMVIAASAVSVALAGLILYARRGNKGLAKGKSGKASSQVQQNGIEVPEWRGIHSMG